MRKTNFKDLTTKEKEFWLTGVIDAGGRLDDRGKRLRVTVPKGEMSVMAEKAFALFKVDASKEPLTNSDRYDISSPASLWKLWKHVHFQRAELENGVYRLFYSAGYMDEDDETAQEVD